MEESEGRFNRVYTDLKGRIISGQFPAGSSFLSAEQLRQEYQIGFHTARNVTARLREEGYIVSRNRKCLPPIQPFVRYCPTGAACWSCTNP